MGCSMRFRYRTSALLYPLCCRLLGDASSFRARESDDIMLLALVLRQWTALRDHLAHIRDALSQRAGKYSPHTGGAVGRRGGSHSAVPAERHCMDRLVMAGVGREQGAGLHVPEPQRPVLGDGRGLLPVGRECRARDRAQMRFERHAGTQCRGVPQYPGLVAGDGQDAGAVRAPLRVIDYAAMRLQRRQGRARGRVPDSSRCDLPTR